MVEENKDLTISLRVKIKINLNCNLWKILLPGWLGTIHSKEDQKCLQHQTSLGQDMGHQGKQDPACQARVQAIGGRVS